MKKTKKEQTIKGRLEAVKNTLAQNSSDLDAIQKELKTLIKDKKHTKEKPSKKKPDK